MPPVNPPSLPEERPESRTHPADGAPASPAAAAMATGRQIARGAAWMVGFKLLDRSVGILSIFVLARLLSPADFGLVAMAMSVVALVELMGAFGFDSALIQRQDATRRHYDTAWTFNVLFGAGIAVLLVALALPAAGYYGEPRLGLMLPVLAGGALVGGFENIGTVAFRKELDFRREFLFMSAKRLVTVAITIPLAFAMRSFWALVAGIVAGKVLSVVISYRLHPFRPRLSLAARHDLLHFSKWLLVSNFIQFLHARAADFVLGRFAGPHGLGIFRMSSEIGVMPSTEIIAPLNRAAYPAYSQLALDGERLLGRFLEVLGMICLIAFPVSTGLFAVAGPFVAVTLGPQWSEAVPVLKIAAATGLFMALQSNMGYVLMALDRPRANAMVQASILAVFLPSAYIGSVQYGAAGAAVAQLGASALGMVGASAIFSRLVGIPLGRLLAPAWRPLIGSIVMVLVLHAAERILRDAWPDVPAAVSLAILVGMGALVYTGVVAAAWRLMGCPGGAEATCLETLRGRMTRRKAPSR